MKRLYPLRCGRPVRDRSVRARGDVDGGAERDRECETRDEAADEQRADRQRRHRRENEERDRGRNDVVEHRIRGDDGRRTRARVALRDQRRHQHLGAESRVGDRRARRTREQHAGEQRSLREAPAPVPDQRAREPHQAPGESAGGEQSAGEQEERDREQQELPDADDHVLHDRGFGQRRADRLRSRDGHEEGMRQRGTGEDTGQRDGAGERAGGGQNRPRKVARRGIQRNTRGERDQRPARAGFHVAAAQRHEHGQHAAAGDRRVAQPLRQPQHGRRAADRADDGGTPVGEHQSGDEGDDLGAGRGRAAQRRGQHPREDVEPHRQRAAGGERAAHRDQRDVEPDRDFLRPHETPARDVANDDGDEHDGEKCRQQHRTEPSEQRLGCAEQAVDVGAHERWSLGGAVMRSGGLSQTLWRRSHADRFSPALRLRVGAAYRLKGRSRPCANPRVSSASIWAPGTALLQKNPWP